ncbi:hypothetical protein C0416_00685 [bacterium]|nr:hypothetical protein [bacterium]
MEKYESEKPLEEMPSTEDIVGEFAKNLMPIEKKTDKEGDYFDVNTKKIIQFVNSGEGTKKPIITKWLTMYAKNEGYNLSEQDVAKKTQEILNFLSPKNPKLHKYLTELREAILDKGMPSEEELKKISDAVRNFSQKLTNIVTKVINSFVIEDINSGTSNRAEVIKKLMPSFKKALQGTGFEIIATGNKVEVTTSNAAKTAEAIKDPEKQDGMTSAILKLKKPEQVASK